MIERPLRHIAFTFGILLLLTASGVTAAEVTWIHDGDTLEVHGVGTVRLLGIDTPEKEASGRDAFFRRWNIPPRRLRQIAREALDFNISQVKGRSVKLRYGGEKQDRYGRFLAYVFLPDGRMLNQVLLERGYAVVCRRFDFDHKKAFLEEEAEARRRGAGLWK